MLIYIDVGFLGMGLFFLCCCAEAEVVPCVRMLGTWSTFFFWEQGTWSTLAGPLFTLAKSVSAGDRTVVADSTDGAANQAGLPPSPYWRT